MAARKGALVFHNGTVFDRSRFLPSGTHVAVSRVAPAAAGRASAEPFLPEQRMALESILAASLAAATSGSARISGLADSAGLITAGTDAGLAVVDADLSRVLPGDIGSSEVVQTWVSGQLACQRS